MSLDDVVNLQIQIQDRTTALPNLGTPLLVGYTEAFLDDLVREFTLPEDMLDAGFTTDDVLYKRAKVVKSQASAPRTFKIGRRENAVTQTIHLIPDTTVEGKKLTGTINGQALSYTIPGAATVQTIVEAVQPTIHAFTGVTATEDNTKIIVEADEAGKMLDFSMGKGWKILDATPDTTLDNDLAAIIAEDKNWYGLFPDTSSKASILLAAAFCEGLRKQCFVQSPDWDILDPGEVGDTASALKAASYFRTYGIYHRFIGGTEWLADGWGGQMLTYDPGASTAAFKIVNGVTVDGITDAQDSAARAKNFSTYTLLGDGPSTYEGQSGGSRFQDIVRDIDWLYAEIQANVLNVFKNNLKVPFTDEGIALVVGAIQAALDRAVKIGVLNATPRPTVSAPKAADVPAAVKATRRLPDVSFGGTLAGALHGVVIRGVVST